MEEIHQSLLFILIPFCCVTLTTGACPGVCITLYDPVCGSNGKTYSNACNLGIDSCNNPDQNIFVSYRGQCVATTTAGGGCPNVCTGDYDPVCGSNGRTYSNQCGLIIYSCNNPALNIVVSYKGQCVGSRAAETRSSICGVVLVAVSLWIFTTM